MSSLRINLSANLAAQGWVALLQLVVIPIYLNGLGVEGYALLSFSMTVLATAQLLDLGLGQTLTRELARYSVSKPQDSRALVITMEKFYIALALTAGLLLLGLSPYLSRHIAGAAQVPSAALRHALLLISLLTSLSFLANFYQCGLIGLERIPLVSGIRVIVTTTTAIGGVLIVYYVSKQVGDLFVWHICVLTTSIVAMRAVLIKSLPPSVERRTFRLELVTGLWRFTAGLSGIALLSTVVSQLDRWVLVGLLTLKDFGYYALAGSVANAIALIVGPLFAVLFPRFSSLALHGEENGLVRIYRASTQLLVATIVPIAIVLCIFAHDVLEIWTRNAVASEKAAPILRILVFGTALNGLMNVPYALHLAYGRTRDMFVINVVAICALVPAIFLLTPLYGPQGAAVGWLAFNVVFACIAVPFTNKTFKPYPQTQWALNDVLIPSGAALLMALAGKQFAPSGLTRLETMLWIIAVFLTSALSAAMSGSETRKWSVVLVRKIISVR